MLLLLLSRQINWTCYIICRFMLLAFGEEMMKGKGKEKGKDRVRIKLLGPLDSNKPAVIFR